MGKSVVILSPGLGESVSIEDRELVHGLLPVLGGAAPVGGDVAQGQPDQFDRRLVAREVAPRLDDLAQPGIDALDGVGGVCLTHRISDRLAGFFLRVLLGTHAPFQHGMPHTQNF